MIACIPSATLLGVDGRPVSVEVHVSNGLPGFAIVGLPDASCREARDRVRAALLSSRLPWSLKRVTVNLAPSGERKNGAGLDLAIAIGLLAALDEVPAEAIEGTAFIGELGLDGQLRRVPGTLSLVDAIDAARSPTVVVAADAAEEAALVGRHVVRSAPTLRAVVAALRGEEPWEPPPPRRRGGCPPAHPDLSDVRGQRVARFALEVAAAGGHHLLMVGPPGAGKTMLARRLPGLLPPLEREHALEATRIHSAAGLALPAGGLVDLPPFRAPHHNASLVSLVGGGSGAMRPGEISLAHRGVLFIDELGEMPPQHLDALRQPLEEGVIRVARARATVEFPARFLFVGAMNPCPCGDGGPPGSCRCSDVARSRYARRLSAPLLDRFDLRLTVARPAVDDLLHGPRGEPTAVVAARVAAARARARERGVATNAELRGRHLERAVALAPAARSILEHRLRSGMLSARGLHATERVARTIADLAGAGDVDDGHVCLALELRAELSDLEVGA